MPTLPERFDRDKYAINKIAEDYYDGLINQNWFLSIVDFVSLLSFTNTRRPIEDCAPHADYVTKQAVAQNLCLIGSLEDCGEFNTGLNPTSVANIAYVALNSHDAEEREVAMEGFRRLQRLFIHS